MKKLLLILLCLPVIGFGQDYKEPKDKYGFAINSVIGWSNSGLFAYRNVSSDVSVVTDSISVINFSDNHSIKLIGSYNPHKYNLKNEDFIDGMHPNENVIKKIFDYKD